MPPGLRILVASLNGQIAKALLETSIPHSVCVAAGSSAEILGAVRGRVRHDVVFVDLLWDDQLHRSVFDGLDVLEMLESEDRGAPVIVSVHGPSFEQDHLAEALTHNLVRGVYRKSDGPGSLPELIQIAAAGGSLPAPSAALTDQNRRSPIHRYFEERRGHTAGRMAAAIATGEVSGSASLADIAKVPINTANKLISYLAPIISERGEAPSDGRVTAPVVHRWCGEHSPYLLSWGRRHGLAQRRALGRVRDHR